jgi:hypothetical protein
LRVIYLHADSNSSGPNNPLVFGIYHNSRTSYSKSHSFCHKWFSSYAHKLTDISGYSLADRPFAQAAKYYSRGNSTALGIINLGDLSNRRLESDLCDSNHCRINPIYIGNVLGSVTRIKQNAAWYYFSCCMSHVTSHKFIFVYIQENNPA